MPEPKTYADFERATNVGGPRLVPGTESDVARAVVRYSRIEHQYFYADHTVKEGNIIVHFYLPLPEPAVLQKAGPKCQKSWNAFWLERFPQVLSPVAKEYFQADLPRIAASYTPEVASWWFVARGFGSVLSPELFVSGFLQALDAALSSQPLPELHGS
jgi:hypothetical protein